MCMCVEDNAPGKGTGLKERISGAVSYTHLDVYKRQESHNYHIDNILMQ